VKQHGLVAVVGSASKIDKANAELGGLLRKIEVL
jgi:hypothetical protein